MASFQQIDIQTLARLKCTAARAMETSINSYQRLLVSAASQQHIARASEDVSCLTVRIAEDLLFLCQLAIGAGIMRGDLRQKLAKVIADEGAHPVHKPIDLRQQRIRRLPTAEGLHLVMDSLQTMCDQVDMLIAELEAGGGKAACG